MKNIFKYFTIVSLLLTSCGDWLDVRPIDQVTSDQISEEEGGFYSALAGLYINMSSSSGYGKAMTISQMEVASQTFSMAQASFVDLYPLEGMFNGFATFNYDRVNRFYKIDDVLSKMWLNSYNVIANANMLIKDLEKNPVSVFSDPDAIDLLLGEALAVRAYCHFDMLRIFQPPYLSEKGKTEKRIPYRDAVGPGFVPSSTSEEILNKIATDLERAAGLMKDTDPISSDKTYTAKALKGNRTYGMNYYAVKGLQARVYLYMGRNKDAYDAAMEVINAADAIGLRFFNDSDLAMKDSQADYIMRSCPTENIFALLVDDIGTYANTDRNTGYSFYERFRLQATRYPAFYSSAGDIRMTIWKKGSGTNMYFFKYERPTNVTDLAKYPKPAVAMLRLGEMYLIAAEGAVHDISTTEALRVLNILQGKRSGGIFATADKSAILAEILKEYRREMMGEGQVFYAYKRVNAPTIEKGYLATGVIDMDVKKYTPDIPSDEYNGGRVY